MKKIDYKLLDSSVWLLYFIGSSKVQGIIESDSILFTSVLSLFEIHRKLMKEHIAEEQIQRLIDFIKERGGIIEVTAVISEKAAILSVKHQLAAIDALIYASAQDSNALLVTADNDFRGLGEVSVIS